MAQLFIAIFGSLAIILTQAPSNYWRKYAPVCGIISQPFFHYETFVSEQFGMFGLSIVVSISWMYGIYTQWIKPQQCKLNQPQKQRL